MTNLEKALERIENINWELFHNDDIEKREDGLGGEFLVRIQEAYKENDLQPTNPLMASLAHFLNSQYNMDGTYPMDQIYKESKYEKYIDVYDPMIQLIEKGIDYHYRERGLDIPVAGLYSLKSFSPRSK